MARPEDFAPSLRDNVLSLPCPRFARAPFTERRPLDGHRVALVSSAGLMPRGAPPFAPGEGGYRAIDDTTSDGDVLMSHVSANFDRTGFQQDLEVVLPRGGLRELARKGVIAAAATTHYSFMGATEPESMESGARELAGRLQERQVTAAVLVPV